MRWDNLFADLELQLDRGLTAEAEDERADQERLRLAQLSLRERIMTLRASYDRGTEYAAVLHLNSGDSVAVRPITIGRDWLSGDMRDGEMNRQCIIPLAAVTGISLLREQVGRSIAIGVPTKVAPAADSSNKIGITLVLRDLCRRRASLEVVTSSNAVFGTIDRVGSDHFDVALHEPGQPRRESMVSQYRIVPLTHLTMVRL